MKAIAIGLLAMTASSCASSQCQQWNMTDAFGITGPTPQVCPGGQPTVTRELLDRIRQEYLPKPPGEDTL